MITTFANRAGSARLEAEHACLAGPNELVAELDDVVDACAFSSVEPDPYSDDGGES